MMQHKQKKRTCWAAIVVTAILLGNLAGCVRFSHYVHWHTPLKTAHAEKHLPYYHCPDCGTLVPKHVHHVCSGGWESWPYYGFQSTCWRAWPSEWMPCPPPEAVQQLTPEGVEGHGAGEPVPHPANSLPPAVPVPQDRPPALESPPKPENKGEARRPGGAARHTEPQTESPLQPDVGIQPVPEPQIAHEPQPALKPQPHVETQPVVQPEPLVEAQPQPVVESREPPSTLEPQVTKESQFAIEPRAAIDPPAVTEREPSLERQATPQPKVALEWMAEPRPQPQPSAVPPAHSAQRRPAGAERSPALEFSDKRQPRSLPTSAPNNDVSVKTHSEGAVDRGQENLPQQVIAPAPQTREPLPSMPVMPEHKIAKESQTLKPKLDAVQSPHEIGQRDKSKSVSEEAQRAKPVVIISAAPPVLREDPKTVPPATDLSKIHAQPAQPVSKRPEISFKDSSAADSGTKSPATSGKNWPMILTIQPRLTCRYLDEKSSKSLAIPQRRVTSESTPAPNGAVSESTATVGQGPIRWIDANKKPSSLQAAPAASPEKPNANAVRIRLADFAPAATATAPARVGSRRQSAQK